MEDFYQDGFNDGYGCGYLNSGHSMPKTDGDKDVEQWKEQDGKIKENADWRYDWYKDFWYDKFIIIK